MTCYRMTDLGCPCALLAKRAAINAKQGGHQGGQSDHVAIAHHTSRRSSSFELTPADMGCSSGWIANPLRFSFVNVWRAGAATY